MLHHEESPGKHEYDMASSHHFYTKPPNLALPPPALSSTNIQTPLISINFEKATPLLLL